MLGALFRLVFYNCLLIALFELIVEVKSLL